MCVGVSFAPLDNAREQREPCMTSLEEGQVMWPFPFSKFRLVFRCPLRWTNRLQITKATALVVGPERTGTRGILFQGRLSNNKGIVVEPLFISDAQKTQCTC